MIRLSRSNRELDKWPLMNCVYVDRRQVRKNEIRSYGDEIVRGVHTSLCNRRPNFCEPDLPETRYRRPTKVRF